MPCTLLQPELLSLRRQDEGDRSAGRSPDCCHRPSSPMFQSGQGVWVVIELKCQLTCRVLKRVSPFPRERLCPKQSPSGSEVPIAVCEFGPWPGFPWPVFAQRAPTASLQNSPSGLPPATLTAQEAHAVIWPRPAAGLPAASSCLQSQRWSRALGPGPPRLSGFGAVLTATAELFPSGLPPRGFAAFP